MAIASSRSLIAHWSPVLWLAAVGRFSTGKTNLNKSVERKSFEESQTLWEHHSSHWSLVNHWQSLAATFWCVTLLIRSFDVCLSQTRRLSNRKFLSEDQKKSNQCSNGESLELGEWPKKICKLPNSPKIQRLWFGYWVKIFESTCSKIWKFSN